MIVQHNMAAQNTNRQLGKNVKVNKTSSEKLASGYRINRAADDASGLAISEKMRAQIRGLNRGSYNCTDGMSLLQTADGALMDVHSILDRLKELSVQSANDTNTDADRQAIQAEVDCLLDEIDRIGNDTEFNTRKIFTGSEAGLIGPDGNPTDHIDFSDINLANFSLEERPFDESDSDGKNINLVAKLTGQYETSDGTEHKPEWPIIYNGGGQVTNTSHPNFRVHYVDDNGSSVTQHAYLQNDCDNDNYPTRGGYTNNIRMTVDNYTFNGTDTCSRVYHYKPADNVSFDITQTIKVVSPSNADYKYYEISYVVKNTGTREATIDFMFHADTAYGGTGAGDRDEEYYTSDGKVNTTCFYNNTTFTDFSIYSLKKENRNQAPFSEKIQWDSGGPDTLAIGPYNQIHQWGSYGNSPSWLGNPTMSGTESIDLGFSLIWSNKSLAREQEQVCSFRYGIAALERDDNIPDELIPPGGSIIHTKQQDLWIQVGANEEQGVCLTIGEMNSGVLGIRPLDMTTSSAAGDSNTKATQAIDKISQQRARLGAYHNRLERAQSVDDTTSENLQASESLIRDANMADEMVDYSRSNILMQAGQAMLAQANQATQGVLQLLR